jgi:tape measure domain-containing protein
MAEGMELATAYVSILPSTRGFAPSLNKQLGGAGGGAETAGKSVGARFTKGLKWAAAGAGVAIGGILTKGIIGGFKRLTAIENAEAKLTGLGHSAGNVEKIMSNALASVKGTAFGLDEAAGVAASTVAAGIKPGKELEGVLKLVGDASTIAGVGMGEMGAIFNKVAASNKIQGDVINQLHDAGIPIVAMLGEELGKTAGEVVDLASEGKIGFEDFRKAMENGLGGAALKSGNTTTGAFKNMNAALSRFGVTLIKDLYPLLGPVFNTLTTGLDKAGEKVGPLVTGLVEKLTPALGNIKDGAQGIYDLLVNGDFTGQFAKAFNVAEDAPIVDKLFTIRENIIGAKDEIVGGITALVAAFQTGGTDVTSSGFAGALEAVGLAGRHISDAIGPAAEVLGPAVLEIVTAFSPLGLLLDALIPVLPQLTSAASTLAGALSGVLAGAFSFLAPIIAGILLGLAGFVNWLTESEGRMQAAAIIIGAVLTPALITWGVQAAIAGVKNVVAWATSAAGAVKAGIVYSLQGIKIVGTWVAMGLAALKSGAQTVAIWAMYKAEAIKGAAVHAVQSGRVAVAWAVQSTAAVLAGAKQKAVWVGTIIASAASGAASFAMNAARVVGGWALMGVQSLLHAAKMAAAWFIALGPIGWVIAAVIGLVALIIANWDTVKRVTTEVFTNVSNFLRDAWNNVKKWVSDAINFVVFWVRTKLGELERGWAIVWGVVSKTVATIWGGIKDTIRNVWELWIKPVFDTFAKILEGDLPGAFETAKGAIENIWNKIKGIVSEPVKFVVNEIIDKGIVDNFNKVVRALKLDSLVLPNVEFKGFDTGGYTGQGSKHQPAGVVHADEYVLRKEATGKLRQTIGLRGLDYMNKTGQYPGFASGGFVHPLPGGTKTSGFGPRLGFNTPGGFHDGVDFAAKIGTPIVASGSGRVTMAGWGGMAGNMVKLAHGNGIETLYYHMNSVAARIGEIVKAGQRIGTVGSTGNSTGPHLHFTVRHGGKAVDPNDHLQGKGGGGFDLLGPLLDFGGKIGEMWGGFTKGGGVFIDVAKGMATGLFNNAKDWLLNKAGEIWDKVSSASGDVVGRARWSTVATNALFRTGNFSPGNLGALLRRMGQESGYDPNAVNNWDSNAAAGTPSKGLMQVIQPTFDQYRDPSLPNNILDPLANIVASINYTKARYGDLRAGWDRPGGYADGGLVTPTLYDGGGWLHNTGGPQLIDHKRRKPDAVLTFEELQMFKRAADNAQGGGDTYELHFHGVSGEPQGLAEEVVFAIKHATRGGKRGGRG